MSEIRHTIRITGREDLGAQAACVRAMGRRMRQHRLAQAATWVHDPVRLRAKRRQVLRRLLYQPTPVPLRPQLLREDRTESGLRRVYRLRINPDDHTEAVLMLPHGASAARPAPALLGFHEHGGMWALGKEKLFAGLATAAAYRRYQRRCYGEHLPGDFFARHGFAVLCIDQIGFGSRALWHEDDQPYRDLSRVSAKVDLQLRLRMRYEQFWLHRALLTYGTTESDIAIHDSRRALDFLQSLPEVDARRIGAFGLSVGAMHCHQVAALDRRIAASVRVCWTGDCQAMLDADGPRGLGVHFMPPSLSDELHPAEWVALSAPAPVLILNGRHDPLYPWSAQQRARRDVARYAARQRPRGRVTWHTFDGGHSFLPSQQEQALRFFRRFLAAKAKGGQAKRRRLSP